MIKIDAHTDYSTIRSELMQIYNQYLTNTPSLPIMDNQLTKLNTPLYYISSADSSTDSSSSLPSHPSSSHPLISPQFIDEYRKALLFIGKCHRTVPSNKRDIDTRDFSREEIQYNLNEFGYIPRPLEFKVRKLVDIAFSASSFRFMCIKAEIAIFLFYRALSHVTSSSLLAPHWSSDVKFIFGAIAYAVNKYYSFRNKTKGMAVYIWELTTFINAFAPLTSETISTIPSHHVSKFTRRYASIADFGDIDPFNISLPDSSFPPLISLPSSLSPSDQSFYKHLSRFPKCPTDIPYTPDLWFYIPTDSDAKQPCTLTFHEILSNILQNPTDFQFITNELLKITNYESQFLLSSGESYASNTFYFKSLSEASDYIHSIPIPSTLDASKVYFCVMIMENGKQILHVIQ